MKSKKRQFRDLRKIFDDWLIYGDSHWGYADLAPLYEEEIINYIGDLCDTVTYKKLVPFKPKGYWNQKLQDYRDEHNRSGLVLLPVYLERAYEILSEKGVIKKEDVHKFRRKLIDWYIKHLYTLLEASGLPMKDIDPSEISRKAGLFAKLIDFHNRGDQYTPYYLEALDHIEAMNAKIELGMIGYQYNPDPDKYEMSDKDKKETQEIIDKNIMTSLVATYATYLIDNFGDKEFPKKKQHINEALKQITDLFEQRKSNDFNKAFTYKDR